MAIKAAMRVICDFDGTISRQDTTDRVLEALAAPAWRDLEEEWVAGRITAAACMRAQVALIGGSAEDLAAVLDAVELDPGFIAFVEWCERRGLPVSIVSDGVDRFIQPILRHHGLERLPVIANRLTGRPGAWRLRQPWAQAGCAAASGVCKCAAAGVRGRAASETTVFVGDGRSDFCVAGHADILFAKRTLADYAAARAQAFHPFDTFDDVTAVLAAMHGEAALPAAAAASI